MKQLRKLVLCGLVLSICSIAVAEGDYHGCAIGLSGFQETPAILSPGKGIFKWRLDRSGTMVSYELNFSGLTTTANVAHIHIGQAGVAGGVMTFLCGGGGKPACPPAGGSIAGTIQAADILTVAAQGVHAGNFSDFLTVLRSGNAYVNVHSTMFPAGEIRGQLRRC